MSQRKSRVRKEVSQVEERIAEIRSELRRVYSEHGGHPPWQIVDPLHDELNDLIAQKEPVVESAHYE